MAVICGDATRNVLGVEGGLGSLIKWLGTGWPVASLTYVASRKEGTP
jgi:hypothetical protein